MTSHCQQQQSYRGLRSPGRSNSTYFRLVVYIVIGLVRDFPVDSAIPRPGTGLANQTVARSFWPATLAVRAKINSPIPLRKTHFLMIALIFNLVVCHSHYGKNVLSHLVRSLTTKLISRIIRQKTLKSIIYRISHVLAN